jgi:hypothetical protein
MWAFEIHEHKNIGLILHAFGRGFFDSYGVAKQAGTGSFFVILVNERTFFSSSQWSDSIGIPEIGPSHPHKPTVWKLWPAMVGFDVEGRRQSIGCH